MEFKSIDAIKTGNFIRELRESHNWTQEQLGDKIFISRKSISKWETGRCCPSIDMLKRLSEALGVTFEELIEGKFINNRDNESSLKNARFKYSKSIILSLFLLMLLPIIFSSRKVNEIYRINYEDANFSISNGTLVLGDNSYFYLGNIKIDLTRYKDSKLNFCLYMLIDEEEKKIIEFNEPNQTWYLLDKQKELILNNVKEDVIENIFLKISFLNDKGEEISYKLNLSVKLKPNLYDKNKKFSNKPNTINSSIIDAQSLDQKELIDMKFLFYIDSNTLKNSLKSTKSFIVNNDIFYVDYIFDLLENDNLLTLYNENHIVQIFLDFKRIVINSKKPMHYIVTSECLLNSSDIEEYYELIKDMTLKLKEIIDRH